ncbi:MAG: SGNH/GDSL hydrolase family protein [Nitrospiraceae bacterium]|nr:SGNH/GDSL hydrolase family protein [Nitrospiraceae bacterium]
MNDNSKSIRIFTAVGIALIVIGIVVNEWVVTRLFNYIGLMTFELRIMIWLGEVFCIAAGILVLRFRKTLRGREILFTVIAFLFFVLLLEGGARGFAFLRDLVAPDSRSRSEELGWDVKPDFSSKYNVRGYGEVAYTTTKYGFRRFGDPATTKTKVFVIGDSVTQAYTTTDGTAYFDVLAKLDPSLEIFAYGCGGYGSLQEYMILDKYIDVIKPDLIIWQFSDNDLINNDYDLESASFANNNHMTRPYYQDGKTVWLYPKQRSGWLYSVVQSSYLLRFLNIRLKILQAEHEGSIEDTLNADQPLAKHALAATDAIMAKVRARSGAVPIVAFFVGNMQWIGDAFETICRKHDIWYVEDLTDRVNAAKKNGEPVDGTPYDAHWNAKGHEIAGVYLFSYLEKAGLLNKPAPPAGRGMHKEQ